MKYTDPREGAHPRVAVALEVEHGEAADVPEPVDVDGELAEEVDDRARAPRERVPQHERCDEDREELLDEERDLHLEQLPEREVDLQRAIGQWKVYQVETKGRTSAEWSLPRHSMGR